MLRKEVDSQYEKKGEYNLHPCVQLMYGALDTLVNFQQTENLENLFCGRFLFHVSYTNSHTENYYRTQYTSNNCCEVRV